jgi:type I restriction enzyme R subunit
LQKALAIYGSGRSGVLNEGEAPVLSKDKLVEALRSAINEAEAYCKERGVDLNAIDKALAESFARLKLLNEAVTAIIVNDDSKRQYLALASVVLRLFKAILPDPRVNEFLARRNVIGVIAERIRSLNPDAPDISGVAQDVERLLDRSVAAEAYVIRDPLEGEERYVDLSRIDFDKLAKQFENGWKRIETEKLRALIDRTLARLIRYNRTRADFREKFQRLIDEYNAGSVNVETFFTRLLAFAKELNAEEQRSISESLNEEELAVFDLLTKPEMGLTKAERALVKKVAEELLTKLRAERLVLDWKKRQQTRAQVRVTIEEVLDQGLPDKFTPAVFQQKCEDIYKHIFDSYLDGSHSVYTN